MAPGTTRRPTYDPREEIAKREPLLLEPAITPGDPAPVFSPPVRTAAWHEPCVPPSTGHPQDVSRPPPHQCVPATPVDDTIDRIGCGAGEREGEDGEDEDEDGEDEDEDDEDEDEDDEGEVEASLQRLQILSPEDLASRHSSFSSMYTNPPGSGSPCQPLQAFPTKDDVEGEHDNIRQYDTPGQIAEEKRAEEVRRREDRMHPRAQEVFAQREYVGGSVPSRRVMTSTTPIVMPPPNAPMALVVGSERDAAYDPSRRQSNVSMIPNLATPRPRVTSFGSSLDENLAKSAFNAMGPLPEIDNLSPTPAPAHTHTHTRAHAHAHAHAPAPAPSPDPAPAPGPDHAHAPVPAPALARASSTMGVRMKAKFNEQLLELRDILVAQFLSPSPREREAPGNGTQKIKEKVAAMKTPKPHKLLKKPVKFLFKKGDPPATPKTVSSFGNKRLSEATFENPRRRSTSAPTSPFLPSWEMNERYDHDTAPPGPHFSNHHLSPPLPSSSRPPRPPLGSLFVDNGVGYPPHIPQTRHHGERPALQSFPPQPPSELDTPTFQHSQLLPFADQGMEGQLEQLIQRFCCQPGLVNAASHNDTTIHAGNRSYRSTHELWCRCLNQHHVQQNLPCQTPVRAPVSVDVDLTSFFRNQEQSQRDCASSIIQYFNSLRNHRGGPPF